MPERAPPQRGAAEQRRTREPAAERQKAVERQRRHRAGEQEKRKGAEQQKPKAEGQQKQKAAEQERQKNATERQRAVEQKKGQPDQMERRGAEQNGAARATKHEQLRRERTKLSTDRRLRLRHAFPVNRDRVSKVRFTARIGTHIPRRVRLFVVPAAVIAIFPYYRDYRYVVVEDTICIVDPYSYEIVDVIDEGPYAPGARPQVAELSLSDSEAAIVLDSIPPDFPVARLRLRLALGAEIEDSVELYEFAPLVVDQVPKLREFRFVVTDDQVVIVAPRDRGVALVLDR